MNRIILLSIFLGMIFTSKSITVSAQNGVGPYDTITTYAKIVGNDTFPMIYLGEFEYGGMSSSDKAYWQRLRYNVYKVYPYAVQTAMIVRETDAHLATLKSKKERRRYLKSRENDLKDKFKRPLKDLTTTQGRILVKLITRQTGKNVYSMLKEYQNGIKARISQTGATIFDNDLKATYDPINQDKDIETIVQEIEAKGYFKMKK